MKTLLASALLLACCSTVAAGLWPKEKFTYVVAYCYDYTQDKRGPSIIQKDGRHHSAIISPATVRLSKEQTKVLRGILSREAKEHQGSFDCFWPHHGFVFYDEKWRPQAHISICLTCSTFSAKPEGVELLLDMAALRKFIEKLELPLFKFSNPREGSEYTQLFERTELSEQGEEADAETAHP